MSKRRPDRALLRPGQDFGLVGRCLSHRAIVVVHSLHAATVFKCFAWGCAAWLGRRAAEIVAKILRGAKPADIPVELPTAFKFVINLKTAKALGLNVPYSMQLLADEVIE